MKFPVWTEIVCLACAHQGVGAFTYSTIRRRDVVKKAKADGWLFKHNDVFCSAECLARHERGLAEPG